MPRSKPEKSSVRGRPEKSPAQKALMRQRIAASAKTLFKAEGFAKVSMRKIAKDIGCTPMTLYGYYAGKIDILRTLWGGVFDDLFAELRRIPSGSNPVKYLDALCLGYINYWLDHPDHYRLVFMAEGVAQPDVSLFLDNPDIVQHYEIFLSPIQQLGSEGSLEAVKQKLDFMLSTLHGIAHNQVTISGYDWSPAEDQIKLLLKAIV